MRTLPRGWAMTTVGEVFTAVGGGTPDTGNPAFWNGTIPWVTSADLGPDGSMRHRRTISIAGVDGSAATLVPAKTVVVATRVGLGKVAIASDEMAFSQDCQGLLPAPDLANEKFTFYQMGYRARLLKLASRGTTISGVPKTALLRLPFSLPPLAEQRRIVEAIEREFSRVDAGDAALARAQARQARLLSAALAEVLRDRRPAVLPLSELLREDLANGRSVPDGGGYPVLRLDAVSGGYVDPDRAKLGAWTEAEGARFRIRQGDFLVVRGNGTRSLVGRGGLVREDARVAFPDTLIRVRLEPAKVSADFLRVVWDCSSVRNHLEGAARTTAGIYKINQTHLRTVPLPVPGLVEQTAIVAHLSGIKDSLQRASVEIGRAGRAAASLRSSILTEAFTGGFAGVGAA